MPNNLFEHSLLSKRALASFNRCDFKGPSSADEGYFIQSEQQQTELSALHLDPCS